MSGSIEIPLRDTDEVSIFVSIIIKIIFCLKLQNQFIDTKNIFFFKKRLLSCRRTHFQRVKKFWEFLDKKDHNSTHG